MALAGSFWFFFLYDVCEEIDLDGLRRILGVGAAGREPSFHRPSPEYVRFERTPVVAALDTIAVEGGSRLRGEVKYYDYGVVSVQFELPFEMEWPELVMQSSKWQEAPELEAHAAKCVRYCVDRARPALRKAREDWLREEYLLVHVSSRDKSGADLIRERGADIAKIVRGETVDLSDSEREEILRSRMSYYPNDVLVVGWSAAFVYDSAEGAAPIIQLLEYANTQLLEYRYYDTVLTRVLESVYRFLDRKAGPFARWRMAREAQRLNTIRLDVRELTERADTSIKFLSDMFSARAYRVASDKVGSDDYRKLVENKLQVAAGLYQFMMDQFHEARAFVLELMIVIILVIDLVFLFRGKS
jgi:hypothetical protein